MKTGATSRIACLTAIVTFVWLLAALGEVRAEGFRLASAKASLAVLDLEPAGSETATQRGLTLADLIREAQWRQNVFPLPSQRNDPGNARVAGSGQAQTN